MPEQIRDKRLNQPSSLNKDKLAAKIVSSGIHWQRQWARWMHHRFNKLPKKTIRIVLAGFCIVGFSLSATNVFRAFKYKHQVMTIVAIKKTSSGDRLMHTRDSFSSREYKDLLLIQSFLDSLYITIPGKRIADSILQHRPGLAQLLEKLSPHQQTLK